MSWTPTQNILDVTRITDNLFAYIEANYEAALIWANPTGNLPPVEKFYKSAVGRVTMVFPSLMLIDKANATSDEQDVLDGEFRLRFEFVIKGGDAEKLVSDAAYYAAALESMLINIESHTLCAAAKTEMFAARDSIETIFDQIGQDKVSASIYYQAFQTEITYRLRASAYL